ncbi:MAG: 3-isopropylmalate dehydrogenase [Candidatus Fischerbacteria bacterium RBG_13_37_8]|uniref:3-isopropylmalate dehydrogenase n=1 Tax=Candidatus Fischerbacteria bacterium RBG_13_37_8 TaxID=1817863 RepID=A0A1F5VY57_9BACT|nr:MAG: 3-isopropylmalate dehydrogenase [Candidatus Fischerbacteria bacterium RBG_13_37_8]
MKIILLPGDGIGLEVTAAAEQVIRIVAEHFNKPLSIEAMLIGGASIDADGIPLTDETLEACYKADAVFLGAIGGVKWDNLEQKLKPEAGLLKLRKSLGVYTNMRPVKVYEPMVNASSLKSEVTRGTDMVIFRELTGGLYFGEPRGSDSDSAWNTMEYSRLEVERVARKAFEAATKRRQKVTSVDKANILECSQFWRDIVIEVGKEYPSVQLNHMLVDNAAMQIVRNPRQFDVILTSNMFGDILSDIAGVITGSLGMLPSASIGDKHTLYEPVHGSAPDIAGQNRANPIGAIASVAMMFEYSFGMDEAAVMIDKAIENTLTQGYRTVDIVAEGCKVVNTEHMTEQIINNLRKLMQGKKKATPYIDPTYYMVFWSEAD